MGDFVGAAFAVPSVYMGGMAGLGDFVGASFAVPSNYLGMGLSGLGCSGGDCGCNGCGMGDASSMLTSIESGVTSAWDSLVSEATSLGVPAEYAPYAVGAVGLGLAALLMGSFGKKRGRRR